MNYYYGYDNSDLHITFTLITEDSAPVARSGETIITVSQNDYDSANHIRHAFREPALYKHDNTSGLPIPKT